MKNSLIIKFGIIFFSAIFIFFIYIEATSGNKENIDNTTQNTSMETMPSTKEVVLTEEEYKKNCIEIYYDDIFFGNDNLEGKCVKLHLLLSEKYFFELDAWYSDSFQELMDKHNLYRDFYKCCVLRKGEDSYVGEQIDVYFSNDYGLDPNNYEVGQKIIVYADVIGWGNVTWDGYNSITIIPRYIENE